MDFAQFLKKQAQIIDNRLEEVLGEVSKEAGKADNSLARIFENFTESSRGGKRIRGALVLLGYQLGGGRDSMWVVDAAVGFEIFQTAILAQDDVIDQSLLRRSRPSLHQSLGGDHRAISRTICLTDIGFFTAYRLISNLKISNDLKIKAINFFSQTITHTVLGELLDIEAPFKQRDFMNEDSLKIALLKTARYTISGPLMLGAILAGANALLLKRLQIFGDSLGTAFQIQDDVLGVFGDEKITGKSASSDIKECKATLLISHAQKKGTPEQRNVLEKYYGNQKIDESGILKVRKVFVDTGALDYANSQAQKYFDEAQKSLKGLDEELLYSLVEFLKKRVA